MTDMITLMDLLVVVCGVYLIYVWYLLIKKDEIKPNVLMPKDVNPKACKDRAGYKAYIGPRLLSFGVLATVCGLMGLLQDYTQALGPSAYIIIMVCFFAGTIFFAYACKKSIERFW